MVRHANVVETHFAWHGLPENIFQGRRCLVRAVSGRSTRIDLRGTILVVAHRELGTGTALEFCQRRKRHRLSLSVAYVELPEIVGSRAVRSFGLHIYLPGAAETVVVVDEQSTHVRLNRVVDIRQTNPLLQHLVFVHIDELLWNARYKGGADHPKLRAIASAGHKLVQLIRTNIDIVAYPLLQNQAHPTA